MDTCFCCCDSLAMELFVLPDAKKRFIGIVYLPILEPTVDVVIVVVLWIWQKYEMIDRSLPQPLAPVKTPKCDLQQLLLEEEAPLRDAE